MKRKLYIVFCVALSIPAIAQEKPPSQTIFFEKIPEIQPELLLNQKIEQPKIKAQKNIHVADPELVRHVAWIGNNMNQIAKHLNQGNQVDNEILMTLVKIQADLDAELQRIMSDDR
jgi:hypothetical protein